MANALTNLQDKFHELYPQAGKPRCFFAPGRVNLIGEHTDYTGGFVMPLALDLGITMLIHPREDGFYHLHSLDFPNEVVFKDDLTYQKEDGWGNYPKGVIAELNKIGICPPGADILISSNLPTGAGLSSSAALGMVIAFGLSTIANASLDLQEMAFLCQRMENNFIGVASGIMDQFAVGFGAKDHAIFLDCLTMKWQLVPLLLNNMRIVITNSSKKRGLQESRYNERRNECEEALAIIKANLPNVSSYRDLTIADLKAIDNLLQYPYKERARHIITENNRVVEAKNALLNGEVTRLGQLMLASHRSLSADYEVTGRELDTLFLCQLQAGCFATRMTGAGFGGCTVSLVAESELDNFKQTVSTLYTEQTGLVPEFYVTKSGDGVRELKEGE